MGPDLKALNKYLAKTKDKPFVWHHHDCFMFTNEAWRAMYGHGWADDWVGKYITDLGQYMKRSQLKEAFGAKTLAEGIDKKLVRFDGIPPRGALVSSKAQRKWLIGEALGICVGTKAVFLGESGTIFAPIETITNAWVQP